MPKTFFDIFAYIFGVVLLFCLCCIDSDVAWPFYLIGAICALYLYLYAKEFHSHIFHGLK